MKAFLKQLPIPITLFSVFFTLLFVLLGDWQLHRYAYKKLLMQENQAALEAPAQTIQKNTAVKSIKKVQVTGHYLAHPTIFLANQLENHQAGYLVFSIFQLTSDKEKYLIERAWVQTPSQWQENPSKQITVIAYLVTPAHYVFYLGPEILNQKATAIITQKLDPVLLSKILQYPINEQVLRKTPPILVTPPERHLGYAIQWFAMAMVLMIVYAFFLHKGPRINNLYKF